MIILQGYFFSFKKNDTNGKYHTAFHTTGLTQFFTIFMPVSSTLNPLSTTGSRKKINKLSNFRMEVYLQRLMVGYISFDCDSGNNGSSFFHIMQTTAES